jgi:hypothetical protein
MKFFQNLSTNAEKLALVSSWVSENQINKEKSIFYYILLEWIHKLMFTNYLRRAASQGKTFPSFHELDAVRNFRKFPEVGSTSFVLTSQGEIRIKLRTLWQL